MAEQYNPVDFSTLSAVVDGKTLLYTDDKVCRSISSLGELINAKIGEKGYATETFVTNEINTLSGTVSTDYATNQYVTEAIEDLSATVRDELANMGNFIVTEGTSAGPILDPDEAETKSIYLVYNDDAPTPDQYNEWIVTENASEEKEWTCIGDTSIDLSDYALSADVSAISDALALKEDKVFVAEYGVTTYADIKAAYDAGKQIVCKYYSSQLIYAQLVQYITYSVQPFIFNSSKTEQDWEFTCINNNGVNEWSQNTTHYYDKTATSGKQELTDAFNTKQDTLSFGGTNNVITAINTSAVGGGTSITGEQDHSIAYLDSVNGEPTWQQLQEEEITVAIPDETEGTVELNEKVYKTIAIGNQIWLAENYVNDPINGVFDPNHPEYGEYFNRTFDINVPDGWHISTIEDWDTLKAFMTVKLNLDYDGYYWYNYLNNEHIKLNCRGNWIWKSGSSVTINDNGFAYWLGDDFSPKKYVNFKDGGYGNKDEAGYDVWWYNIRLVKDSNAETKKYIKSFTDLEFMAKTDSSGNEIMETYATKSEMATKQDIVSVGTDLKLDTNTISINTNGTADSATLSFVAGSATNASNWGAAFGIKTKASNSGAFACGSGTSAIGEDSFAEGRETKAQFEASHAEGWATTAYGSRAHAEGVKTYAYGDGSHAEGNETKATGMYSHAEGQYTSAKNTGSHAEGDSTSAEGNAAHSEGSGTHASALYSHAEGFGSRSYGDTSHSEGYYTTARGKYSHAAGNHTYAKFDDETVIGRYNIQEPTYAADPLLVVGNGTSAPFASDAFFVLKNGTISATNIFTSGINVATYISQLENTISNLTTLLESYSGRWVLTPADTIETTSGILHGEIDTASGNLQEQIDNIGSPLTYSGTKTVDEINALENINTLIVP